MTVAGPSQSPPVQVFVHPSPPISSPVAGPRCRDAFDDPLVHPSPPIANPVAGPSCRHAFDDLPESNIITHRRTFENLLADLLAEHCRCVHEAAFASDVQHKLETEYVGSADAALREIELLSDSTKLSNLQKRLAIRLSRTHSALPLRKSWSTLSGAKLHKSWSTQSGRHLRKSWSTHSGLARLRSCQQLDREQNTFVNNSPPRTIAESQDEDETELTRQGSPVSALTQTSQSSLDHLNSQFEIKFFHTLEDSRIDERRPSVASVMSVNSSINIGLGRASRCTRLLSKVIESNSCEVFVGLLIFVNAALAAAEMQYFGFEAGYVAEYPGFDRPANHVWPNAETVFFVSERILTVIFAIELVLRLWAFHRKFFRYWLNWIDVICVVISLLDWVNSQARMMNPTLGRLLRLVRWARAARWVRLIPFLSSLHLLCKSIAASISTLTWSVLLLIFVQSVSGMVIHQLVHKFITDETAELAARQEVFAYYGTFSRAMITMFEVHLANFGPACRVLLNHVGEGYAYLFLGYRCLAGFAIINVINAVFVQQTIAVAQQDEDVTLNENRKAAASYAKKLRSIVAHVDKDHDGCISLEDMKEFQKDPTSQLWMKALDIEASDLVGMFRIIDVDNDGLITADELMMGAARIRGTAKSIDMAHALACIQKVNHKLDGLVSHLTDAQDSDLTAYFSGGNKAEQQSLGTL